MDAHHRLSSSLATLQAAKRREELLPALSDICSRYGLSHMTFLVVRVGDRPGLFPYYSTTYPDAWTKLYCGQEYFRIDPVIEVMRRGVLPVDWSALDQGTPEVQRFFEEAHSHDIGPHGLTIPIRGPSGERCLFSVASNLSECGWTDLSASSIHDLHILSYYLNETVLAVTGLREAGRYRSLSRRESQCLQLLATGRISKQIASALGISESAVKLYLRSARGKLGASTSYQAVAKASFLELIEI
ncbi:LuxR family transcriptional regulator [Rhizobiaceae bacterium n13]|uniref:helix-turn-helix transcriptional regulator n=1 Tax=Ferirhizobium litorale TaxID=2927786 RepID=UPI0024B2FE0F|nr:LuxR family transcriptional regulator [Fererhizobium litorale]MDI7864960.1 LuxR family transcriptional regulator [Fererhizobium litorale]